MMNETVRYWLSELEAARKRDKDYIKMGNVVLDIYQGKKKDSTPFNILYSNTETLLPALYSVAPRPVVQRRFKDDDPLGKAASAAAQRALEYGVDTNLEDYQTYSEAVEDAVTDALLPGRGVVRVKYDAKTATPEGQEEMLVSENVCFEAVDWNRLLHGYARKWKDVPWISIEHDLDKGEVEALCGKAVAEKTVYTPGAEMRAGEKSEDKEYREQGATERKTAKVYEIWDKRGRTVLFVSSHYTDGLMKSEDDPLQLSGFFPIPRPLMFLKKTNSLDPTAIYTLYENQAKELNRITIRLNRLIEALKVRGGYNSQVKEMEDILRKDDNTLVAITNAQALESAKGLESAIWLVPIEKIIVVVQQLFLAREQCKQVIYEITGIADILRGASKASETLGAQQIKEKWGGLRIKKSQAEVQRFCRDLLRLASEIMATKFQESTWAKMTQLPYSTTQEVIGAKQVADQAAQVGMPPPPDVQAIAAKPPWPAVLQMLKDDLLRSYRVDIETNSTLSPEATEDQQQIMELLQAVGQFLSGVTPLITSGSLPFGAAQSVLLGIVRRFRFGSVIEDQVMQMQPPVPPEADKAKEAAAKLKIDQQAAEMSVKSKEQDALAKIREKEFQLRERELDLAYEKKILDLEKQAHQQAVSNDVENLAMKEKDVELTGRGVAGGLKNQAQSLANTKQQVADLLKQVSQTSKIPAELAATIKDIQKQIAALETQISSGAKRPIRLDVVRNEKGRAASLFPVYD